MVYKNENSDHLASHYIIAYCFQSKPWSISFFGIDKQTLTVWCTELK